MKLDVVFIWMLLASTMLITLLKASEPNDSDMPVNQPEVEEDPPIASNNGQPDVDAGGEEANPELSSKLPSPPKSRRELLARLRHKGYRLKHLKKRRREALKRAAKAEMERRQAEEMLQVNASAEVKKVLAEAKERKHHAEKLANAYGKLIRYLNQWSRLVESGQDDTEVKQKLNEAVDELEKLLAKDCSSSGKPPPKSQSDSVCCRMLFHLVDFTMFYGLTLATYHTLYMVLREARYCKLPEKIKAIKPFEWIGRKKNMTMTTLTAAATGNESINSIAQAEVAGNGPSLFWTLVSFLLAGCLIFGVVLLARWWLKGRQATTGQDKSTSASTSTIKSTAAA